MSFLNAQLSIYLIPFPIVTSVNWPFSKARDSIVITLLGISTLFKWLSLKASLPIVFTLFGIFISINLFLLNPDKYSIPSDKLTSVNWLL